MRVPEGLGEAGAAVWDAIVSDVGDAFELDARELVVLEAACRQADTNRQLEDVIEAGGLIVEGSQGQPRMSAAVTELRQGRLALERLLASLALPDEDGRVLTAGQRRAQAASQARWGVRRGAA